MIKTVIVDDEDIFRRSLKSIIDWNDLGLCLVGEAADGRQALTVISQTQPDIVISDIKMPIMDGLCLMKEVHQILPAKFIILSGYQDHELIRTAIQFGAFDYILKPVRNDEIIGVLLRAVDRIRSERAYAQQEISEVWDIRELISKYESLFIHFIEIRDIDGTNQTVSACFQNFSPETLERNSRAIEREFIYLAYKICDTFKVNRSIVTDYYTTADRPDASFQGHVPVADDVCKLFELIIKDLAYQKNTGRKDIVQDVIEVINEDCSQNLSLEWVAQTYYINPSYFCQMFKSVTNDTFMNYVIRCRIDKAKELMQIGNLKIYQIAHMVGYTDEKHFSQLFKKHTGMTPSDYQKRIAST